MKTLFILFFSSITVQTFGCGWFPSGEEFRFALFQPSLSGNPDAYSLFYSSYFLNDFRPLNTTGPMENLSAWHKHFEGNVPVDAIDELVYRSTLQQLEDLKSKNGEGYKLLGTNKMVKELGRKERDLYLDYLIFARKNEILLNAADEWGDVILDYEKLNIQLSEGIKRLESEKIEELKVRYAYQCIVLSRYIGGDQSRTALMVYNQYLEESDHVLKYWALMHKAYVGSYLGEPTVNFFIDYAMAFRNCDSKKRYISLNYFSGEEMLKTVLEACKTNEEKAAVLAVNAFRNPGKSLDQIQLIYEKDMDSPLLPFLFIREINKLEDWYLTKKHTGFNAAIYESCWNCQDQLEFINARNFLVDKAYLKEVLAFAESLNLDKTGNKPLFRTIRSYLYFMLDEDDKALGALNKITKDNIDPSLEAQIRSIRLLIAVKNESASMDKVAEHLRWFEKYKSQVYDYDRFLSQLMLAMAARYEKHNDKAMAALCRSRVGTLVRNAYNVWGEGAFFYYLDEKGSPDDVARTIKLINNPGHPFLEYVTEKARPYLNRLMDLQGTKYLRADKLDQAAAVYASIPAEFWTSEKYVTMLDCDPFYSEYYERHERIQGNKTYTKPEFVEQLIRYRDSADHAVTHRSYYNFLLGNAYFNMTQYGNSWYYVHYGWTTYGQFDPGRYNDEYYYDCSRANTYYQKAFRLSEDNAFAAFCLRMSAKCEYYKANHISSQETRSSGIWNDRIDMTEMKNIYRQILRDYPDHYDKLVRSCSHFEMYLDRWRYS